MEFSEPHGKKTKLLQKPDNVAKKRLPCPCGEKRHLRPNNEKIVFKEFSGGAKDLEFQALHVDFQKNQVFESLLFNEFAQRDGIYGDFFVNRCILGAAKPTADLRKGCEQGGSPPVPCDMEVPNPSFFAEGHREKGDVTIRCGGLG